MISRAGPEGKIKWKNSIWSDVSSVSVSFQRKGEQVGRRYTRTIRPDTRYTLSPDSWEKHRCSTFTGGMKIHSAGAEKFITFFRAYPFECKEFERFDATFRKIRRLRVLLSISSGSVDVSVFPRSRVRETSLTNQRSFPVGLGSSGESGEKSLRLYLFFIELLLRVLRAVIRTNGYQRGYSLSLRFATRRTRQGIVYYPMYR